MTKRKVSGVRILAVLGMTLIIAAGCEIASIPSNAEDAAGVGDIGDAKSATEIRLFEGNRVPTQSRVAAERANPIKFDTGEIVYVYAVESRNTDQISGTGVEYTATETGKFTPPSSGKLYYPASGSLDIFIVRPQLAGNLPAVGSAVVFTVKNNQTTKSNYLDSDLLYAGKINVVKTADYVGFNFYHVLTKIQVVVKAGTGLTDSNLSGAKIEILGTKLKGDFKPARVDVTSVKHAIYDQQAVAPTASSNTPAAIEITNDVTTEANFVSNPSYNNGIIIPQAVAANTDFIKVTLNAANNNRQLVYKIPVGGKNFEPGKAYIFKLTANLSELKLEALQIVDFTDGGTSTGDLE